ncbi:MAG: hypothetical protein Q4C81_05195 [Kocuria sp.]|nr:hypothetical protein [Kocuria sp.]
MSQDRFLESSEPSPEDINVPDVVDFESNASSEEQLPAPEIDLGGGAEPAPKSDKPLGPRRLALLREQMAQHAKELAENQNDDPEHVDEDLAQKQLRMAELASRAALSSDEDRVTAERAMAAGSDDSDASAATDVEWGSSGIAGAESEGDYVGASFSEDVDSPSSDPAAPRVRRRDLRGYADDAPEGEGAEQWSAGTWTADPQYGGSEADVAWGQEQSSGDHVGVTASTADTAEADGLASDGVPADDETTVLAPTVDDAPGTEGNTWALATAASISGPGAEVVEHGGASDSQASFGAAGTGVAVQESTETEESSSAAEEGHKEPAEPVSALEAQGLDLLDPDDYRQASRLKAILTILAAVIIPAVIVIVLMVLL